MADILDTELAGPAAIRGGVFRTGAYAASVALSLVSVPLLTRHLGPGDFGSYTAIVSLITIVAGLTDAGLTNLGIREFSVRSRAAREAMLGSLLTIRTILASAGVLAAVGFGLAVGYSTTLLLGTLIAGAGLLLVQVQATLSIPMATFLRLGWLSLLDLARQVVAVALTVALILAGAELLPFFIVFPVSSLAALLLTVALVRGEVRLVPTFDRAEWAAILRDALPYAAATAFGVMYFRVALIVSSVTASETQTGYFSVAFRIQEIVVGVAWVLVPAAFPILARAARDDETRLRYGLQRLFEASLILGTGLAVLTAVGAPFAVRVIGGSEFTPATAVLRIEAIATLPSFLVITWGFALLSRRRHRELLAANAMAFLLTVGLSLALIHDHGAKGAAVAVVATETFLAIGYGLFLMWRHPALRASPRLAPRVALAAALAAAVGFLLPVGYLVRLLAATGTYGLALVALRTISPDVWRSLARRETPPAP